ncbi:beta-mannosidase [Halobacillus andaensis]|uniref:beta-mannosidase n=1 Tax=Halobacillus andaensis TaxID=1176239 RepID=UPI003D742CE0
MKQEVLKQSINEKKQLVSDWTFKQVGNEEWLPAKVPGCVHTDLLRDKKIKDPFHGKNELDLQWIDKKDWEYETVFDASDELFSCSKLELVFHGLDTYAEVTLNGQMIVSANNMFRTWKIDVTSLLQQEKNHLHVYFRSPIEEDLNNLSRQGYNLPAVNDHSQDGGVGDKNLSVFARKAPYHYGWDWGPRFVTSGLWKEVELIGWTENRITDVYIHQKNISKEIAELNAILEVEAENAGEAVLTLSTDNLRVKENVYLKKGWNRIEVDAEIKEPKRWWPRGLGKQHLYTFTATLKKEGETVAEKSVRTGLRSIKLVREKDDKGKSFYFEVNGFPLFAKGANHIPNDSFVTEVTYERYKHEILSAVESNMNMLRIWGGGIYEYDAFYELCDEYGILVWQDFMFACSMYPGSESFLQSVKAEAEETVKKLRNYASIALWCGNNEIDTAWAEYDEQAGWGWKEQYSEEERKEIGKAYDDIFHHILPEAVERFAPGGEYWPSSPLADWTGDHNQHASFTTTSGDIHYWDVWHGLKPFEDYNTNVGRFMSEYGFQSFPEYKTVKTYAEEADMKLESEVMLHHQKNDRGNYLIKEYMEKYLPKPKDFPSFLYLSQILQAEGIKTAIEAHRRKKPYCMGTLYWQMNDCWPVASWASMDYYGRWKALHYYVKKSFKDLMLSIDGTQKNKVEIHLISDNQQSIEGNVHMKLVDFNGKLLEEAAYPVKVLANSEEKVISFSTKDWLRDFDTNEVVLVAEIQKDDRIIDRKQHYFVPLKELKLQQPIITITEAVEGKETTYLIETDKLAKQVWLSSEEEGIFSDNYFDLLPGEVKRISFLRKPTKEHGFSPGSPGKIEVKSMTDFINV